MAQSDIPALRWGILGCGMISSWFVSDIVLSRPDRPTNHIVQAIGSSSIEKAEKFTKEHCPSSTPTLYASYDGVYNDPSVDIVYIGTPHSLHFKNAMDAINAGKNVLCEKPLTINAKEATALMDAAKEKNVFFMEALWTRFFPLASALQKLIHEDKIIGEITRVFIDFGLEMPISSLPANARTADPALGAGALLDIGIYSLTWASLILDHHPKNESQAPKIVSSMSLTGGADEMTSIILNYPKLHAQAICTASMLSFRPVDEFCRIEGWGGSVSVGGSTSRPEFIVIRKKGGGEERIDFETAGWGFWHEQDAVAGALGEGKKECSAMPMEETIRMMKTMDAIREANGLRYPQDD